MKEKLAISRDYIEEAKAFKPQDTLLALILYVVLFVSYFFLGKFFHNQGNDLSKWFLYGYQFGHVILILILIILICRIRKQTLSSIGITYKGLMTSSSIGLIISAIIILFFGILSNWQTRYNLPNALLQIAYYFIIISIPEELVFRGFIGKRFYGVLKNKIISMIIVALLFTLLHFPFQMAYNDLTLTEYFNQTSFNLIFVFLLHFVFHYMYAKHNNIAMPVIVHAIWDFAQNLFI